MIQYYINKISVTVCFLFIILFIYQPFAYAETDSERIVREVRLQLDKEKAAKLFMSRLEYDLQALKDPDYFGRILLRHEIYLRGETRAKRVEAEFKNLQNLLKTDPIQILLLHGQISNAKFYHAFADWDEATAYELFQELHKKYFYDMKLFNLYTEFIAYDKFFKQEKNQKNKAEIVAYFEEIRTLFLTDPIRYYRTYGLGYGVINMVHKQLLESSPKIKPISMETLSFYMASVYMWQLRLGIPAQDWRLFSNELQEKHITRRILTPLLIERQSVVDTLILIRLIAFYTPCGN